MALDALFQFPIPSSSPLLPFLLLLPFTCLIVLALYRISSFHPLSQIPGPLLPRLTSLYLAYHAFVGDECTWIQHLHALYGPLVCIGPNAVDISDSSAMQPIYSDKGGFRKAPFYSNFSIDGHETIFSETVPERRAVRAKAILPLFSMSAIRSGRVVIEECVSDWLAQLNLIKKNATKGEKADILEVNRALALDVLTGYLFGRRFGSLAEINANIASYPPQKAESRKRYGSLSAAGMVDSMVAVSKLWYLPSRIFQHLTSLETFLCPDPEATQSIDVVDTFITSIVHEAHTNPEKHSGTYQARLLAAGLSLSEVKAQCKDLIFAGTDSTGMNLSTMLFMLAKHPDVYTRLRSELTSPSPPDSPPNSHSATAYLKSLLAETLRLALANPARLPRVTPASGLTFQTHHIPPGSVISVQPYSLHLNPSIFPDPLTFNPDRWTNSATEEMKRASIPFGVGSRQCIARNLAMETLLCAVEAVGRSAVEGEGEGLMHGASTGGVERIEVYEWFNARVRNGRVDLVWN